MNIDIDFNLENYTLLDILNLFKLNINYTDLDIKNAKKLVLKMHPDKSGLPKEYFLFYCKAFRIIKNMYEFRRKKDNTLNSSNSDIEYIKDTHSEKGNKILVDKLMSNKKDFHKWFNKLFDEINIIEEEKSDGHGTWLKSDEDIDTTQTTLNEMHNNIVKKKNYLSSIVKHKEISEFSTNVNAKMLDNTMFDSYSSDIFSKLSYEDVKIAHTETVIPISENDYKEKLKFNNVELYKQYRNNQNTIPLNEQESKSYLNHKNEESEQLATQLAYKLHVDEQKAIDANNVWWSKLKLLL